MKEWKSGVGFKTKLLPFSTTKVITKVEYCKFLFNEPEMEKSLLYILTLIVLLFSIGCNENNRLDYPNTRFHELSAPIYSWNSLDSLTKAQFITDNSPELEALIKVVGVEGDLIKSLTAWSDSKAVEVFTPLVETTITNQDSLLGVCSETINRIEQMGFQIPVHSFATVVYGRPESILFTDSVMLLALNHYLGPDFPGYSHIPQYIRQTKRAELIPYDLAESILATQYSYVACQNASILNRMLYEGALINCKLAAVPQSSPPLAMGYTLQQFQWLQENEANLWKALVNNGFLFDKSQAIESKLLDNAPNTAILSASAPGKAARYIGWRIVEKYLKENRAIDIPHLLTPEFYCNPEILARAQYNP